MWMSSFTWGSTRSTDWGLSRGLVDTFHLHTATVDGVDLLTGHFLYLPDASPALCKDSVQWKEWGALHFDQPCAATCLPHLSPLGTFKLSSPIASAGLVHVDVNCNYILTSKCLAGCVSLMLHTWTTQWIFSHKRWSDWDSGYKMVWSGHVHTLKCCIYSLLWQPM